MNGECLDAFKGVSTVFHCAAFISYEFPSNVEKFEANNVEGIFSLKILGFLNQFKDNDQAD